MATITFYEKPGCINNTKQKALLRAAGYTVEAHNLLTEAWSRDRLRRFFGDRPVVEWFNPSAPPIKAGVVHPNQLDADTALSLMLENPLLIRRPLWQIGDRYEVGFDIARLEEWMRLQTLSPALAALHPAPTHQDLETCPRSHSAHLVS